jgi:hypothetical protein
MNAIDETTYENFEENNWGNINQFGIWL